LTAAGAEDITGVHNRKPSLTMALNLSAQCYLRAFDDACAVDGGWLHADALRAAGLDYSLASLERLDRFVGATLAPTPALGERLAGDRAAQNTAFLLGFYAGEVLARALLRVPRWSSGDAPTGAPGAVPPALHGLRGALLCDLGEPAPYAPLACLLDHLHAGAPGLGAALRARLPAAIDATQPLAPQSADWPLGLAGARPALAADGLPALRPETPVWAKADGEEPLNRVFARVDALLLRGRVVWGALVQANNLLFQPEFRFGAPGEVLYDPQGRSEPEALEAIARMLLRMKSEPAAVAEDPALQRYAGHLRDERTRLFGFALNGRLLPYPLLASSTYFDQCQLPDGMLSLGRPRPCAALAAIAVARVVARRMAGGGRGARRPAFRSACRARRAGARGRTQAGRPGTDLPRGDAPFSRRRRAARLPPGARTVGTGGSLWQWPCNGAQQPRRDP
jgi:hypothetical protein